MQNQADNREKISDVLASILRSGRAAFNAQFAEARRAYPDLDGAAFLDFLRREVNALVLEVVRVQPERAAEVALAAYEAGLELVGQKLAGRGARHRVIEEGWRRVLVAVGPLVAIDPARVIGSVCNALHYLTVTSESRPEQWIRAVETLGPRCAHVDSFLRLGQVVAWRAGLAHFRPGALAAADLLPPDLAVAALGAPSSTDWPGIRERLRTDPWFDPAASAAAASSASRAIRVVARVGAFRGFGGVFVEPPTVAAAGEHFLVRSGDECWLLTVDVFGATFHRAQLAEFELAAQRATLPEGVRVSGGAVVWGKKRLDLSDFGTSTSASFSGATLALTTDLTHGVLLIAVR